MKLIATTVAMSLLLFTSGCSTNSAGNQTVQQRQACTAGDPHPWCMQMAQTRPLGAAPYGLESSGLNNPEMQMDSTPYPTNPALPLITPGKGPLTIGGMR